MRSPKVYIASVLTLSMLLASLFVENRAQTKGLQESNPKATVLFVVSAWQLPDADIVPFDLLNDFMVAHPGRLLMLTVSNGLRSLIT